MGISGSKSDDYYSDNEKEKEKFEAVVSTALERCSFDQNYSLYENQKFEKIQQALKFHEVRGKNIKFSTSRRPTIAKRDESSFCDGIVFSDRSILLYERVYIKILKLSSFWNGMIRFGFTTVDPNSLQTDFNNNQTNNLPKYVYPDLTNKEGYWAASLPDNSIKENDVIFYYVDAIGDVHYGLNDTYLGIFLSGVNTIKKTMQKTEALWAMIDIYGNTLSIELFNSFENRNSLASDNYQLSSNYNMKSIAPSTSSNSSDGNNSSSSATSSSSFITVIPNYRIKNSGKSSIEQISNKNQPPPLPQSKPPALTKKSSNECITDKLDRLLVSFRRQCVDNHLNETLRDSMIFEDFEERNSEIKSKFNSADKSSIYQLYKTIPILFHEPDMIKSNKVKINNFISNIHGKNVEVNESIAYRKLISTNSKIMSNKTIQTVTNGYVFIEKPIENGNRSFCLQVVGIDNTRIKPDLSLSIGCTTCDPNTLNISDLPDDSDNLLDRSEYWIVFKNFYSGKDKHLSVADELCFKVNDENGNIEFSINGNLISKCLFNVDLTQKLWFFFDLCGKVKGIRLIQCCSNETEIHSNPVIYREYATLKSEDINQSNMINFNTSTPISNQEKSKRNSRPNSALIEFYKNQLNSTGYELLNDAKEIISNSKKERKKSNLKEECRVCWENPIECVLYSCGHMCLCWNCAMNLKNQKKKKSSDLNKSKDSQDKPLCPICRTEIIDIIRFFKS